MAFSAGSAALVVVVPPVLDGDDSRAVVDAEDGGGGVLGGVEDLADEGQLRRGVGRRGGGGRVEFERGMRSRVRGERKEEERRSKQSEARRSKKESKCEKKTHVVDGGAVDFDVSVSRRVRGDGLFS